jgi:hypothetical protein
MVLTTTEVSLRCHLQHKFRKVITEWDDLTQPPLDCAVAASGTQQLSTGPTLFVSAERPWRRHSRSCSEVPRSLLFISDALSNHFRSEASPLRTAVIHFLRYRAPRALLIASGGWFLRQENRTRANPRVRLPNLCRRS